MSRRLRFDRYDLDTVNRRLRRDGEPIDLSGRYLDALILLVAEAGNLVTKARFMEEVWRGAPVTDEALTQCIRALRRELGDDAARPRFIETAPKHGYRFIAKVERLDDVSSVTQPKREGARAPSARAEMLRFACAGALGGAAAGGIGGLIYGLAGVATPTQAGGGAVSAVLVIAFLTSAVGLIGGAGVGLGVGASAYARSGRGLWMVFGGALGGAVIGALVRLVGLDAFTLLFGQAPQAITGAPEGFALGGAIGVASWLAQSPRLRMRREVVAVAGALTGLTGVLIALAGGRLMGGSLDQLATVFPNSQLRLDALGPLVGEAGFGPFSRAITAGLEGALFGACVIAAMIWKRTAP